MIKQRSSWYNWCRFCNFGLCGLDLGGTKAVLLDAVLASWSHNRIVYGPLCVCGHFQCHEIQSDKQALQNPQILYWGQKKISCAVPLESTYAYRTFLNFTHAVSVANESAMLRLIIDRPSSKQWAIHLIQVNEVNIYHFASLSCITVWSTVLN